MHALKAQADSWLMHPDLSAGGRSEGPPPGLATTGADPIHARIREAMGGQRSTTRPLAAAFARASTRETLPEAPQRAVLMASVSFWAVRRQAQAADPWGRPDMLQYRRKRSQGFLPPETQPTAGNAAKAARLQRPPSNKAPWLVHRQHARCACRRKCIEHE